MVLPSIYVYPRMFHKYLNKCKEISRYLQRAWFRCETAYISGLPNWANKSAQTHCQAVTKARRGRGNCIRTRAIVVTFCQGLSGSGSVVESFFCVFLLGVLNSAESRSGVCIMASVLFFVGHHVRFQIEISEMWTFQNKKTWRIPEAGW